MATQDGQILNEPENVTFKDKMAEDAQGKTKELLNKIKSAMEVWSSQNEGKPPELTDLFEMLKPKDPNEIDPTDPRILHFKIYFGRNSDSPLFYHDPTTGGYFDTTQRQWSEMKPEIVDHLNERDIGTEDVFDGILHGVIDDQDYDVLEKMNLIDNRSKQLWNKLNTLYQQTQDMQKSLDEAKEKQASETGKNAFNEILKGAGVSSSDFPESPADPAGENMLEQIMAGAMTPPEDKSGSASSPAVDMEAIRRMVRAEIANALGIHVDQMKPVPEEQPSPESPAEQNDQKLETPEQSDPEPKETPKPKSEPSKPKTEKPKKDKEPKEKKEETKQESDNKPEDKKPEEKEEND